jgi:hypothetical protein
MRTRRRIITAVVALLLLVAAFALLVRAMLGGDRIKAAIEAQATAALGHPVTIRTAVPRIYPRVTLDLTDVVIGAGREVTIAQVGLSTGLRGLIGRRVEDARVTVESSRIDGRWALALLSALAAPAAVPDATTTPTYALTVVSIGSIAMREVTLVAGSHTLLVDMDSALTGSDLFSIRQLRAKSDRSDFSASGEITSIAKRTGQFRLDAEALDIDGLLAFLAAATPTGAEQIGVSADGAGAPPVERAPLHADIAIQARQAHALGIAMTGLTSTCRVAGGDVTLEDVKVGLFGGQYAGSAAFRGGTEGRYEWRGTFENLDVPQLAAFANAPGTITGRLGGTVALAAAGADPLVAIRRARGSARVAITDGRIPGLEIVRNVVLAFGKPSSAPPEGSGEAFTRLAATLAIAGQTASTSDLTFASRDFDMRGEGTLAFPSGAVDFRTDVILSRELSEQAGRDLYRAAREDGRIVLPARITGTVASPTVLIDVQAALRRALRNKVEDEIKGLFDRFRKKLVK